MNNSAQFKTALKALALGESNSSELVKQLPDGSESDWGVYVMATFSAMMEEVFKHDHSLESIKQFADKVRFAYRNAQPPIKSLALEGLIRGMLGEEHFLDEITPEEQYSVEVLTIGYISTANENVKQNLDSYLSDGEKIADIWLSEEELVDRKLESFNLPRR